MSDQPPPVPEPSGTWNPSSQPRSRNFKEALARLQAKAREGQSSTQAIPEQLPSSRSTAEDPTFRTPSHQEKFMTEQEQVNQPTEIDFSSILDLKSYNTKCAVMTLAARSEEGPGPIGYLTKDHESWSVRLKGDGGRYGVPRLEMSFEVRHPSQATKQLKIWWRPGMEFEEDQYGIADMDFARYNDLDMFTYMQQPQLFESLSADLRQKCFCLRFSNHFAYRSGGISDMEMKAIGLAPLVRQTLNDLFNSTEPCGVLLWFRSPLNVDDTERRYVRPLQRFINQRIPPFVQYYDEAGKLAPHWENMPMIQEMGKGMYVATRRKDGTPLSFYKFPVKTTHEMFSEWALSIIIPVIRNVQWERAQLNHLEGQTHHLLIIETEHVSIPHASKTLTVPGDWYGFIRLKPISGKFGRMPDRGTFIFIDYDNSQRSIGRDHAVTPRHQRLKGRVVNNEALCKRTGTHFCVSLKKPRGFEGEINPAAVQRYATESLAPVWLEPELDTTSATRDLDAVTRLADRTYLPESLGTYRTVFTKPLSRMPGNVEDLSLRKPDIWALYKAYALAECADNTSQQGILQSIEKVTDGIVVVAGPPGAGKTKSLVDVVLGLALLDYKVLVVGPSNAAVNKDATETLKAYMRLDPELQLLKTFVRLEVQGAELRAMIRVKDWMSRVNSEEQLDIPEVQDDEDKIEEDLEVVNAMDEAAQSFDAKDRRFQQLQLELGSWYAAMERFRNEEVRRDIGVPRLMTTGHHLYELSARDEIGAAEEWETIKDALLEDPKSTEWVHERQATYGPASEELKQAWAANAITEDEINRRVEAGSLKSEIQRDPSYEYRELQLAYIAKRGKLSHDEKKKFIEGWSKQLERVLKAVDVVFTTCNNSGSDLLKAGFSPEMLLIDEAGQVNMPSMAIPLTVSPKIRGTWLFGDSEQLPPKDYASAYNEFSDYAKLSSIAHFEMKGWHILRLNIQYRMCPPISQFPAKYFYNGNLEDHPSVIMDTDYRKVFRSVTRRHYRMAATGGSELIAINVRKGRSAGVAEGTSAYNIAHAIAVARFAIDLLLEDDALPAQDIVILIYYAGQYDYIMRFLNEMAPNDEIRERITQIRIFTVDKYQGEQAQYVLLDTVVSRPTPYSYELTRKRNCNADESMVDAPMNDHDFHLSTHLKEPGRICCAITRAKAGLAIFCNYDTCATLLKQGVSRRMRSLGEVLFDIRNRGLMYNDEKTVEPDLGADEMGRRVRENKSAGTHTAQNELFMNRAMAQKQQPRRRR